jgi:hypothetical protein
MSYPKHILKDLYWAFSEGPITDENEFVSRFEEYHKDISSTKKIPFKWNDVAFEFPKIKIQYLKYNEQEEDHDEPDFIISSSNGKNLSYKDLLFNIHQECGVSLENDDRCYFEGLMYSGSEDEGIPLYFMVTGN